MRILDCYDRISLDWIINENNKSDEHSDGYR